MFIRRKQNKSGSISVHISTKVNGRQVHVKTVGHTSNAAELLKLEAKAQQEIDLLKRQNTLPLTYSEDAQHIAHLKASVQSIEPQISFSFLEHLFYQVGFHAIPDNLFRHLVVMRLLYPVSKLKTIQLLKRYYDIRYDINDVYRYLDKLNAHHLERLQQISFNHTSALLKDNLSVVFYDVTTLYFEAEREDDLRKTGFSKDGKAQHPQIVLGLLVSTGGYPLAFEMFEGNKFEGHTMLPVVEAFRNKFKLQKLVIIADAGLLSTNNIENLTTKGYEFILGARIKAETESIKQQILNLQLRDGESKIITKPGGIKLVVSYASARAQKDEYNRKRGLQKLEKSLQAGRLNKQHINNRGYNKYLKLEGSINVSIDYTKFRQDAAWDGLKAYLTNTQLNKEAVIENYKHLWQIEKAFRISKTDLKVRPIYHRLPQRIKAHLSISFCSFKIYKELERQLKEKHIPLSCEKTLEVLKSIYSIKTILPFSKKETSIIMVKNDEQKQLLTSLGINY